MRLNRQRVNFTTHSRTQGRINQLMAREGALTGEFGGNHHGLEMGVIVTAHDGSATG
jgi:hypothetical protein